MQALYTETFEDFLKRHEQSTEWQEIVTKLGKFPRFTLGELDFDIYTLIKEKFKIWEIGAETESLFVYEFNDSVNELSIKYIPKIEMYINNFATMLDRKIALGSDGQTDNILYPVSTIAGKVATSVKFNSNKDNPLMIFKSNGELLAQAMDIKNIYLDCLAEFEKNFMTIY